MIKDTSVAARYARALFMITEKRGETAQALGDLQGLWGVLEPDTPAGRLLATPMVRLTDKRATVLKVLEGRTVRSVAVFVDLLLRKKRLVQLPAIVTEFEALVERQQGIQRAQVVSAVPLHEDEQRRLHAEIEKLTGKKIRLTADVDARLLGGALVRIGDRVIDRSVRTLLEATEQRLLETSV
ncbi:MAG: ATP synthase F1 subunit delta [Candidatus Eisenbacteria bacterium]